jgi:DNA-binding transcriptional LysR family regulator
VLVGNATSQPRGHVRLLLPPSFAVHQVVKRLPAFYALYPQVTVELHSPGPVEAMDEGFDLTIFTTRQPLAGGDFIARRLAKTEVVLCASPEYLDRHGRPGHPRDLQGHALLLPPTGELQRGITFATSASSGALAQHITLVPQQPVLTSSHIDTHYAGALHGLGVAGLPSFVLEDALLEQALERVLPAWRLFDIDLWLALPSRKHLPARTRALLDFLVQAFGGEASDPWLASAGCETCPLEAAATAA